MQDMNVIERSLNKAGSRHIRISSMLKPSIKSQTPVVSEDERTVDLMILLDSVNSLFTSSLLFDEQSLAELVCALAQLMMTKMSDAQSGEV